MKTRIITNRKRTFLSAAKRLFIVLFSLSLAYGASAQRGHTVIVHGGHGGYHGAWYPRTYVGVGFGFGYPWGYPYGWYSPWYGPYPPYYYGYGAMPNQLELQVRDIKSDYAGQIKAVRHDKALTHKERRAKIDQLKADRDAAIVQARHDYFNHSRQRYNDRNSQQPRDGNSSSSGDGPEYQDSK